MKISSPKLCSTPLKVMARKCCSIQTKIRNKEASVQLKPEQIYEYKLQYKFPLMLLEQVGWSGQNLSSGCVKIGGGDALSSCILFWKSWPDARVFHSVCWLFKAACCSPLQGQLSCGRPARRVEAAAARQTELRSFLPDQHLSTSSLQ